jgi:hypothetical protein
MALPHIRKFLFKNASSEKVYEVALLQQSDGTVDGVARLLGTAGTPSASFTQGSTPGHAYTEVAFVVVTGSVATVMDPEVPVAELSYAAYYHATDPAQAGAALSTLAV